MSEGRTIDLLTHRLLFCAAFALILFVLLIPRPPNPGSVPGPDLLLCLALTWVIRRPEYVPPWLLAMLFLLADLLLMRPPGMWTAIVLVACETLRNNQSRTRTASITSEFGMVVAILMAMFAARWLLSSLAFVSQPSISAQILQLLSTMAAYPAMVALTHFVFGVHKQTSPSGFGRMVGT